MKEPPSAALIAERARRHKHAMRWPRPPLEAFSDSWFATILETTDVEVVPAATLRVLLDEAARRLRTK